MTKIKNQVVEKAKLKQKQKEQKQQQCKQANTLKRATEIPNYMPIYTDIHIYIHYNTYYILHQHAYI